MYQNPTHPKPNSSSTKTCTTVCVSLSHKRDERTHAIKTLPPNHSRSRRIFFLLVSLLVLALDLALVYLSACLSVCLSASLSACLSFWLARSVAFSLCLSGFLSLSNGVSLIFFSPCLCLSASVLHSHSRSCSLAHLVAPGLTHQTASWVSPLNHSRREERQFRQDYAVEQVGKSHC